MTSAHTERLSRLEAEAQLLREQIQADREVYDKLQAKRLSKAVELGNEIESLKTQISQEHEKLGLYGRLASVATLQDEFRELNIRSLVNRAVTNGLESALVRPLGQGRNCRVLIDRRKFNEWLEEKRCG